MSVRDAERSVLGGIMLSKRALEEIASVLKSSDFEDWRHDTIFAACISLLNAGEGVDAITVADRLIQTGDLKRIGGAAELHQMTSDVITTANALWYADIVREHANRRRLTIAAQRMTQTIEAGGDAATIAEVARREIDEALGEIASDVESVGFDFDDIVASLDEPPRYIRSPWQSVDALIDGFRPGALYVIGARPGGGKSLMGLAAAAGLAKHGNVAFSSLEMSRREITLRLIASRANVLLHALVRHVVQPHQWDAIAHHRDKISQLPIFIDDRGGQTLDDVRAHVRSVARKGHLTGIVVDYLQLLRAADPSKPRWEAVGDFTRSLKALAREYDVPVIALAQLNRRTEGGVARPGLSDLRESGNIEQDADVVMLLQRVVDPDTDEPGDELEVVVGKNRHGQTGVATLWWEGAFARIRDWPSNV